MAKESRQQKIERAAKIVEVLRRRYPGAKTSLDHQTPHQLLVATILSAQATDAGVNKVTPALFRKYPTIEAFAAADPIELREAIKSINFLNNKTKAIIESAKQLVELYGGKMPQTIAELTRLKGVGRKTASVVLGNAFGIAEGIVVDTHVIRLSRRLGLTTHEDAAKIEQDLMKILPPTDWIDWTHMIILHGRSVCTARRPDCPRCPLQALCPSASKLTHLRH